MSGWKIGAFERLFVLREKSKEWLYLRGFAVSVICVSLKECNFDIIEASHPEFRDLDFSDTRMNGREMGIDRNGLLLERS